MKGTTSNHLQKHLAAWVDAKRQMDCAKGKLEEAKKKEQQARNALGGLLTPLVDIAGDGFYIWIDQDNHGALLRVEYDGLDYDIEWAGVRVGSSCMGVGDK